jgi:hypothetical protein
MGEKEGKKKGGRKNLKFTFSPSLEIQTENWAKPLHCWTLTPYFYSFIFK